MVCYALKKISYDITHTVILRDLLCIYGTPNTVLYDLLCVTRDIAYDTSDTVMLCGLLCVTVYMAQRTPCCVVCCALRYVWHSRHPVVCFFVRYDRPIYGAADTVLCGLLCVAAAVYDTADTVMLCGLLCKRDIWHS